MAQSLQVDNKRSGAHAGITEAVVPERRYRRGVSPPLTVVVNVVNWNVRRKN